MNRLSTIRNLLLTGSLVFSALAVFPLSGCALEGDSENGAATGTDELVEGAKNDPSTAHSGTTGGLDLQLAPGSGARNTPAVLESNEGEGPQPQPWIPPMAIRSTSSSNNK